MEDAIDLMRWAFSALSRSQVEVPVRTIMDLRMHEGRALFMPVYSPMHGQVAQKVVLAHPNNARFGLPFIHALVFLLDAANGTPLAILDGECITALRTGAASGLGTDLLAVPDASTVAIFGAGVQARTQLAAVCAVRPIEKALIFGRSPDNATRFAAEATETHGIDASVNHCSAELAAADVICTATTSMTPVFEDAHVKAGCHINGVGSYRPDMNEIPAETVMRATVFVDQRAAAMEEAGDLIVPMQAGLIGEQHVSAELGEVATGKATGRSSHDQVTFFKSVGNAVQDLAVASRAYAIAIERGLGVEIKM